MNYFDLYSSYPDHSIAAAWHSQVKEVDKAPWLADALKECGNELFARFAARYAELRALPRGARRALQRRIARSSELTRVLPEYLQRGGRRLQHRMAWSLAGAALLLALGQGPATAATITVTTSTPDIAADGQCSLIEAIVNSNNHARTHRDCPAGSGTDTIVLPANANIALTNVYSATFGPVGLPRITSQITIEGNGATISHQGNATAFTLLAVNWQSGTPGDLTLKNLTLDGGGLSSTGVQNYANLSIKNSVVSGNAASGVWNAGNLTIEKSTISNNTTNDSGGALFNWSNTKVVESTISGNTASSGGGIYNRGILTIENSTLSGNTANAGGGVFNNAGRLTITNSTISGNIANDAGGLLNNFYCDYYYGGCWGGTVTLENNLIAGNQAPVAAEIKNVSGSGAVSVVNADHFNLFGSNGNAGVTGFTPGPSDIVPAASLAQIIGPLQNNLGPTDTHALVVGSPAIDTGNPNGCGDSSGMRLPTDQRGFPRHVDGNIDSTVRCDIGAVEYGAEAYSVVLSVGGPLLPDAEIGLPYTSPAVVSGGVAPYSAQVVRGALPPGLSFDPLSGALSGTVTAPRNQSFKLQITDQDGVSATGTFHIKILRTVGINTNALKSGTNGRSYNARLKVAGGKAGYSWSLLSGPLPSGLNLDSVTGVIAGIPTQAGAFPLTVQVIDALGGVDAANLTLKIR